MKSVPFGLKILPKDIFGKIHPEKCMLKKNFLKLTFNLSLIFEVKFKFKLKKTYILPKIKRIISYFKRGYTFIFSFILTCRRLIITRSLLFRYIIKAGDIINNNYFKETFFKAPSSFIRLRIKFITFSSRFEREYKGY